MLTKFYFNLINRCASMAL